MVRSCRLRQIGPHELFVVVTHETEHRTFGELVDSALKLELDQLEVATRSRWRKRGETPEETIPLEKLSKEGYGLTDVFVLNQDASRGKIQRSLHDVRIIWQGAEPKKRGNGKEKKKKAYAE